jgi:hypothetical protein
MADVNDRMGWEQEDEYWPLSLRPSRPQLSRRRAKSIKSFTISGSEAYDLCAFPPRGTSDP